MERLRRDPVDCRGKKAYPKYATARRSARIVYEARSDVVRPFKCGVCGRWHVGGVRQERDRPVFASGPSIDDGLAEYYEDQVGMAQ